LIKNKVNQKENLHFAEKCYCPDVCYFSDSFLLSITMLMRLTKRRRFFEDRVGSMPGTAPSGLFHIRAAHSPGKRIQ
jgi:hypothetical protein